MKCDITLLNLDASFNAPSPAKGRVGVGSLASIFKFFGDRAKCEFLSDQLGTVVIPALSNSVQQKGSQARPGISVLALSSIFKFFKSIFWLMLFASTLCHSQPTQAAWQDWSNVGNSELTWGPFLIYQITLTSPSGNYQQNSWPLALTIRYKKNIDAAELITATQEQWQHLGLLRIAENNQWATTLKQVWPDVKTDQQLAFVANNNGSQFYFKSTENGQFVAIGSRFDTTFRDAFLAIWLSEQTTYPQQRQQLMGLNH